MTDKKNSKNKNSNINENLQEDVKVNESLEDSKKNSHNSHKKISKKSDDSFVMRGFFLIIIVFICMVSYYYIKDKKKYDEKILKAIEEVAKFDNVEIVTFDLNEESDLSDKTYNDFKLENQQSNSFDASQNIDYISEESVTNKNLNSQNDEKINDEKLVNVENNSENNSENSQILHQSFENNEVHFSNNFDGKKYANNNNEDIYRVRFELDQKIKNLKFEIETLRSKNSLLRDSNRKIKSFAIYQKIKNKIDNNQNFANEIELMKKTYISDEMVKKINLLEFYLPRLKGKKELVEEFQNLIPELFALSKFNPDLSFKEKIGYNFSKIFVIKKNSEDLMGIDKFIANAQEMLELENYTKLLDEINNLDYSQQNILVNFKEDIKIRKEFIEFDRDMIRFYGIY